MFEGLVVSLLNKYLGEYLENLDKDSLGISIRQGTGILENMSAPSICVNVLENLSAYRLS